MGKLWEELKKIAPKTTSTVERVVKDAETGIEITEKMPAWEEIMPHIELCSPFFQTLKIRARNEGVTDDLNESKLAAAVLLAELDRYGYLNLPSPDTQVK